MLTQILHPWRSRSPRQSSLLFLAVLGSLAAAQPLRAQLIAYDGFSYPAGSQLFGTAVGQGDGGTGWSTTWSATSAAVATNNGTGLIYSTLAVSGGGVVMGNPNGSTATTASSERLLPGNLTNILGGAGTVWISFLYQNWQTSNGGLSGFREAKLALFSGATTNANGSANVNGTERLDVGTPNTYLAGASDTLSLFAGSTFVSSGTATPRGADPANTVFVLLRLDVDATGANDTAYAWFNPSLASQPSTGSAISFSSADLSAINGLRFQAGNLNASGTNAVFEADELRVGLTFADVAPVPEPSAIALVALTGVALAGLARARKRTRA